MQHLNYYTLQALTRWLQQNWTGCRWIMSFSQQKDELVILLKKERHKTYLRISFDPVLCYIAPFKQFRRARANTINLLEELNGKTVESWSILPGERLILARIEQQITVAFKLHGTRGNILVLDHNQAVNFFRHGQGDEQFVLPTPSIPYNPVLLPEWNHSQPLNQFLKPYYPAFDGLFYTKIEQLLQSGFTLPAAVGEVINLASAGNFTLAEHHELPQFLLWPPDNPGIEVVAQIPNVADALEAYVQLAWSKGHFEKTIADYHKRLNTARLKAKQRLESLQKSIQILEKTRSEEQIGHLLLANLHRIPPKADAVTVFDYYNNQPITIPLDPDLNGQQNAEAYYKKHKDNRKKYEELSTLLPELQSKYDTLNQVLDALQTIQTRSQLKQFEKTYSTFLVQANCNDKPVLPYRVFGYGGYEIRVGKNAKANDELTFKHCRKEDIWMHSREGSGAHVVIRRKPGQALPSAEVLEYAAGLAGYFSSQRGTTMAAIAYTLRKYVRKLKKSGKVIYTQEKTILTEPIKPNTS